MTPILREVESAEMLTRRDAEFTDGILRLCPTANPLGPRVMDAGQHNRVEQWSLAWLKQQDGMNTKAKGDIAEQAVILQALKRGWGVSKPIGDRLPYDLIFDVSGVLLKVQVKSAWYDRYSKNYVSDSRRTKTNRRVMLREAYQSGDFDFAVLYVDSKEAFWVMPVDVFVSYVGPIHLVVDSNRTRSAKSDDYKDAWGLIEDAAAIHQATA
jgi:hypothetical protein